MCIIVLLLPAAHFTIHVGSPVFAVTNVDFNAVLDLILKNGHKSNTDARHCS